MLASNTVSYLVALDHHLYRSSQQEKQGVGPAALSYERIPRHKCLHLASGEKFFRSSGISANNALILERLDCSDFPVFTHKSVENVRLNIFSSLMADLPEPLPIGERFGLSGSTGMQASHGSTASRPAGFRT